MPRRLAAIVSALTLALCYARAGSWVAAARHGDPHACCGRGAPLKSPTMADCCVTPAAVGAVHIVRVDAPAILAALPVLHEAPVRSAVVSNVAVAWRGRADRADAPARAPPLA
ncbi:MAG: hypothetical protein ACHQ2Z_17185 [Elusimicrobiota bacterium]